MKSTIIFKKGKILHYAGKTRFNTLGLRKEYYDTFDEESQKYHIQTIEQIESGIIVSCDCTHQSLHQPKRVICSHIISVILRKCGEVKIK